MFSIISATDCVRGSMLRPILFLLYTSDLTLLIEDDGLHSHLYADVTQIMRYVSNN